MRKIYILIISLFIIISAIAQNDNEQTFFIETNLIERIPVNTKFNQVVNCNIKDEAIEIEVVTKPDWIKVLKQNNYSIVLEYNSPEEPIKGELIIIEAKYNNITYQESAFIDVTESSINLEPQLLTKPKTSIDGDLFYEQELLFHDFSDKLEITIIDKPEWLNAKIIDNNNSYNQVKLFGFPKSNKPCGISINVSDKVYSTTHAHMINITNYNNKPYFRNIFSTQPLKIAKVNNRYHYHIKIKHLEGYHLAPELLPEWIDYLSFPDNKELILSGTPSESGINSVILKAYNNEGYCLQAFDIEVFPENKNVPPVFTSDDQAEYMDNDYIYYNISVYDIDNDIIDVEALNLPQWLKLKPSPDKNNHYILEGDPPKYGQFDIKINATDSKDTSTFDLSINLHKDSKPVFIDLPEKYALTNTIYQSIISGIDPNNKDVSITATQIPEWLTLNENTESRKTEYILEGTPVKSGNYPISLHITNGNDITQYNSSIIVKGDPNLSNNAPLFTSTPPSEVYINDNYIYNINCIDTERDNIRIYPEFIPNWLTFQDHHDGTATISGQPNQIGTFNIIIFASDEKEISNHEFIIEVKNIDPYQLNITSNPNRIGYINQDYSYNIKASNNYNERIDIYTENCPDWLYISQTDNGQAILSGKCPNEKGTHFVNIIASTNNHSTHQSFKIDILDQSDINLYPPIFLNEPNNKAYKYRIYSSEVVILDRDKYNDLNLKIINSPNWLFVEKDEILNTFKLLGVPNETGDYNIDLEVSDGKHKQSLNFTINVAIDNFSPIFTSEPITNANLGEEYVYNITAESPKGKEIVIESIDLPQWLNLEQQPNGKAILSGTPTNTSTDNGYTQLIVKDGIHSTKQVFQIHFNDPNSNKHAPVFITTPVINGNINTEYSYTIRTFDEDGDDIYVSIIDAPEWINLTLVDDDSANYLLQGVPQEEGSFHISLNASDGVNNTTQEFNIIISDNSVNTPPSVICKPITEGEFKKPYYYGITAIDLDMDLIQFEILEIPSWLNFFDKGNNGHALLSGIPKDKGIFNVRIKVSDGKSSSIHEFEIHISSDISTRYNDKEDNKHTYVYPNPFNSRIRISFADQTASIIVVDINNKSVYSNSEFPSGNYIDLSSLPSGIYTVLINNKTLNTNTKIIKQ
ncbi:MAG: putative Ig domain-containing protein [Hyphomicrobiales bacterium]